MGTELLVHAPGGGNVTVNLSSAPGRTLSFEWFDPAAGHVAGTGTVPGGSSAQSFSVPASITADAVLYIVDSAGHA